MSQYDGYDKDAFIKKINEELFGASGSLPPASSPAPPKAVCPCGDPTCPGTPGTAWCPVNHSQPQQNPPTPAKLPPSNPPQIKGFCTVSPDRFSSQEVKDIATNNWEQTARIDNQSMNIEGEIVGYSDIVCAIVIKATPASILRSNPNIGFVTKNQIDQNLYQQIHWAPSFLIDPNERNLIGTSCPKDLTITPHPASSVLFPTGPISPLCGLPYVTYPHKPHQARGYIQMTFDISPEKKINPAHYPHKCPRCESPAYVGVAPRDVDCSNADCQCHRNDHT